MSEIYEIDSKIKVLFQLLEDKVKVLEQIFNICSNQKMFFQTLDEKDLEEYFNLSIQLKQELIEKIKLIDEEFISIFSSFQGKLNRNKEVFSKEIEEIKNKIQQVMDLDIKIRVFEESNKTLFSLGKFQNKNNLQEKKIEIPKVSKSYLLKKYSQNTKLEKAEKQ